MEMRKSDSYQHRILTKLKDYGETINDTDLKDLCQRTTEDPWPETRVHKAIHALKTNHNIAISVIVDNGIRSYKYVGEPEVIDPLFEEDDTNLDHLFEDSEPTKYTNGISAEQNTPVFTDIEHRCYHYLMYIKSCSNQDIADALDISLDQACKLIKTVMRDHSDKFKLTVRVTVI